MIDRKQIKDLAETGHPHETAQLIIECIKGKKEKSKTHIEDRHSISIHFNKKTNMVNIDVQEEQKLIAMSIPYKIAIAQSHDLAA